MSMLEDARRDVGPEVAETMRDRHAAGAGIDRETFDAAAAVIAAQRNLRILGVFARLSMHFGKPAYVDLIPRLWGHIRADLEHPALADVRSILDASLPPPDPAILDRLKAQCGTVPTR
jgi:aminoglycoside/choline kinase family phosphotransferase